MSKNADLKFHIKAALIDLAVRLIARFTHLERVELWALLDEFGRENNVELLQDIILRSPELLTHRIERDVDKAVIEYNEAVPQTELPVPVWIDDADGETDLGGTLGFSYDFVVDLDDKKEEN